MQNNPAQAPYVTPVAYIAMPLGFQQVTGMTAATALTVPTGARFATIQAATQAVSWRDDGTAPTASVGMQLAAGSTLQYSGNLAAIEFIQVTSGAILNVSYYM